MNNNTRYFLLFVLFVGLQLFLFTPLQTLYVMPCLYLLFLLLLPIATPTATLLLWAFAMGLCIDLLGPGIAGLHTAALLTMALLRNALLKLFTVKGDSDNGVYGGSALLGNGRFIFYVALCVLAHHLVFFTIESMGVFHADTVLLRTTASLCLNTVLLFLFEKAFFARR